MKKTSISVTEAARNFADCVNRVRYQGTTFILEKNGEPVAQLTPVGAKGCTGAELAATLARVRLSASERRAWQRDLDEARKHLLPPPDRWK